MVSLFIYLFIYLCLAPFNTESGKMDLELKIWLRALQMWMAIDLLQVLFQKDPKLIGARETMARTLDSFVHIWGTMLKTGKRKASFSHFSVTLGFFLQWSLQNPLYFFNSHDMSLKNA